MPRAQYVSAFDEHRGKFGPGKCGKCGAALPPRKIYWCSDKCVQALWIESKSFSVLREKVLAREDKCAYCNDFFEESKNKRLLQFRQQHPQPPITQPHSLADWNDIYEKLKQDTRPQVDHIKPVALFPELEFEESNLQAVCVKCHKVKSRRDAYWISKKDRSFYLGTQKRLVSKGGQTPLTSANAKAKRPTKPALPEPLSRHLTCEPELRRHVSKDTLTNPSKSVPLKPTLGSSTSTVLSR